MVDSEKAIEAVISSFRIALDEESNKSPMRYNEVTANMLRGAIAACESLSTVSTSDIEKTIDSNMEFVRHLIHTLSGVRDPDEFTIPLLHGYLDGFGSLRSELNSKSH